MNKPARIKQAEIERASVSAKRHGERMASPSIAAGRGRYCRFSRSDRMILISASIDTMRS
mgnify:CR=1 FL=1